MPPTEDTDGEALPMYLEPATAAAPSEVPGDEEEIAAKPAAAAISASSSSREPATNAPANREETTAAKPAAAATPTPSGEADPPTTADVALAQPAYSGHKRALTEPAAATSSSSNHRTDAIETEPEPQLKKKSKLSTKTPSSIGRSTTSFLNLPQTDQCVGEVDTKFGKDSDDFIERETLIKLSLKKGGQVSSQYYRVLGIFDKYYNKWFVEFEKDKKSHSIHRVKRGRPTQTSTNSW